MSARTIYTLGACAVTSLIVVGLRRIMSRWTKAHLQFDFPLEQSSAGMFV